jgi:AcrR family transcriptional regulator
MTEIIETKDDIMKRNILVAAQQLFQEFGLGKTTMEDIARKIGKAKSSLYYYYTNKEEIFVAVVMKEKMDVEAEVKQAVEKATTCPDKLRAFAIARFRAIRKRKVLYKILGNEMQQSLCMVNDLRENYNRIEHDIISNIITEGVKKGEFNIDKKDIDIICYVLNSSLRGLEFDAMMSTQKKFENPAEVVDKAIYFLLRALKCG